jgi:hypothetical protein
MNRFTFPLEAEGRVARICVLLIRVFATKVLFTYTLLLATKPEPVINMFPPEVLTAFSPDATALFVSRYAILLITGPLLTVVVDVAVFCPVVTTLRLITVSALMLLPLTPKVGVVPTTVALPELITTA